MVSDPLPATVCGRFAILLMHGARAYIHPSCARTPQRQAYALRQSQDFSIPRTHKPCATL